MSVNFTINGRKYTLDGRFGPDVSLIDFIRTTADQRGTKVMCQEGGCGACIVSVTATIPPNKGPKIFSVNSCLVSALSCHGWEVTTVEGIGNRTTGYSDLQRRLAHFNGTQCGFCTPGWITSMHSLLESRKGTKLTVEQIENSFAANICRCTGYRPIVDAFKSYASDADETILRKLVDLEDLDALKLFKYKCAKNCGRCKDKRDTIEENVNETGSSTEFEDDWCKISHYDVLTDERDKEMIVIDSGQHKWYKAYTLEHVFQAMKQGDYKLIAGNTGQGVYHIDGYPKNVIDIMDVEQIKGHHIDVNLIIGAGTSLAEMMEIFLKLSEDNEDFSYLKQLYEHMDLVAHIPVRNIGTIAGNLCVKHTHKDFTSDVFILLETVGAMVTIAEDINKTSMVTMTEFLNVNLNQKILINVLLPPLSTSCCSVITYKIMSRSQNSHAIVNAGFSYTFQPNTCILEEASIVYGGLSPDFIHASKTEATLKGQDLFTEETLQVALKILSDELEVKEMLPEPAAEFRKSLAVALFYKGILKLCPNDRINPKYRSGGDVIKRSTSKGTQVFDTDKAVWPLNQPVEKLEALVQCSGESVFANDYPKQCDEVFAVFVTADVVAGSVIAGFDPEEALKLPGVTAFYTVKDFPGVNAFTPVDIPIMTVEEEILCDKVVKYYGQPAGIIVAEQRLTAQTAAKLVKIEYSSINSAKPLITVEDVLKSPERDNRVVKQKAVEPTDTGKDVKEEIQGEFKIEGQYHFTMETQTCVVVPTENGMDVYSSTQWLDLTNVAIARCLNIPVNSINVIVRRVGGAYGSKCTRAAQVACSAALVTHLQGKVCRFVLSIQDNMKIMGKRLPTTSRFKLGVNSEGEIQYLYHAFYHDVGCSFNEAFTADTALINNGYNSKRWLVQPYSVATDTPSNTWCRAPGTTEAVSMIENIMENIAFQLDKDPIEVRLLNLTNRALFSEMIDQLKTDSNYEKRVKEIKDYNERNRWRKRALKILPLTYGIFYFGNYNCIVSIYHGDGSVVVIHGGIEMGQGLNTKVAQVCAYKLGIPLNKVSVKPSTSFTSPNAMVTGGSIGSECVSFATVKACEIINERLKPFKEKVTDAPWEKIVVEAYTAGVNLQASYACEADDIKPYDVYAVCALEVEVDILTGNHDVRRLDLLEDTGRSLNPELDVGQIEGAFVMGLGYWTSEKLVYDNITGKLLTDRTWNYKPPGIKDIPADMRIYLRRNAPNEFGVLQSKATGEPALCLATTVIHALREAVEAARREAGYDRQWVAIENPCTVANIFMAIGHDIKHYKLK